MYGYMYICIRTYILVSVQKYIYIAIKRPRTRSTAARQVSNAYERDLVTNQNV